MSNLTTAVLAHLLDQGGRVIFASPVAVEGVDSFVLLLSQQAVGRAHGVRLFDAAGRVIVEMRTKLGLLERAA